MARKPKVRDDGEGGTPHERIVREAKHRFEVANTWESGARKRFIEDVKFVNGDSDNLWQWPDTVRQSRGIGTRDERPCLTINKTNQHCLQIINDAKQNKTSARVRPVGNEATYEAAKIYEGIIRRIEYISNADVAYTWATKFQVWGGMGFWRLATDWVGDDTFDQDIFIRIVKDPLTVLLDPDYKQPDGSDMRYAFVFEDMAKDEFEEAYPQYKDSVPLAPFGTSTGDDWLREDHVRVAEYFRRVQGDDKLILMTMPDGRQVMEKASVLGKTLTKAAMDDPQTKHRAITTHTVERYLIVGNEVVEENIWAGTTIPIYPVPGEVTTIEGQLDRKGHVRWLKDPQRMYNYNSSAEIEYGALQSKSPYVAPVRAIENLTEYWETANVINYSVLPYNDVDDDGQPIERPERAIPPQSAPAYLQGMQTAANDMMLVSGQYQAEMGAPSNERSGVAIQERQRQGDNATYHFIDNLAMAIRRTCRDILELIPEIYDTKRALKIYAEDGTESDVLIDPGMANAYLKQQQADKEAADQVFLNPNVGRYDVEADVGPAFATRRQEAFNAFVQILSQNPDLVPIVGDLMFRNADFPGADEIAERLKRMVPPQAMGDGPTPEVQQLTQQLQGAQQLIAALGDKLKTAMDKEGHAAEEVDIRGYEAVTKRLDVIIKNLGLDQNDAGEMEREMALQAHSTAMEMLKAEHAAQLPQPNGAS